MVATRIAVIYGSAREGRFCDTVAGWVAAEVTRRLGRPVDIIDPAGRVESPYGSDDHESLGERLEAADGFIVVTPEYNHSFPAPLKALIDRFSRPWHAKPVAFVSYGGVSGGLRAVEHLRTVFAELHAVGLRDGVSFPNAGDRFDADGGPVNRERAERALATMLARLEWWAGALRDARSASDYEEAAA